jgi:hypothetical protein
MKIVAKTVAKSFGSMGLLSCPLGTTGQAPALPTCAAPELVYPFGCGRIRR